MKTRQRLEIIPRVVDTNQRRIILNVGGRKHETYLSTVRNYPDTRLYWVVENVTKAIDYDSEKIEVFFDRHPGIFEQVLNYYRTGKLHCPHDVCGPLFEEELAYWGIDEKEMEHCCWTSYSQHRDAEQNLKSFNVHEDDLDQDTDLENDRLGDTTPARDCGRFTWWTKYQPKIWPILEDPHSSKAAKIFSIISVTLIMLSVGTSCALTLPQFSKNATEANGSSAQEKDSTTSAIFKTIDYFCGIWFTLELLLRIIFCPRRRVFFRQLNNWIDILSVLPFYLRLFDPDGGDLADALLMIRLLRLYRFFRLLYGLQILLHTLKASSYELGLLLLILLIPVILFSSIIYYIEHTMEGPGLHTKFRSIPESFWWSLITMTTVGYGDMVPLTWMGKIIGGACAICGLLVVALPISIIGSNFNLYYAHAQARLKLPRKRNKVLLSSITSDFSNRSNASGPRRRGLRMRSRMALEAEEGDSLVPSTRNSGPYRLNSLPNNNSCEAKRNSRTWSLPTSNCSDHALSYDAKTSPTGSRGNRERQFSRNERITKLGDLPEKDETEDNDNSAYHGKNSEPHSNTNNNSRNSLNVPGVTKGSLADRLPLWIAENSRTPRVRSFSVPSNTQRPLRSTPPPRKTQSQSTNICKRCSLPRETPNDYEDDNSKSLSGAVCCCSEKRAISGDTNNSTYTILIPGVDEGVQVSMESIPLWSRELPFHGGGSPIQLNMAPRLRRTVEDSDPENLPEQDEQGTVISELGSEHNGEETSNSPLLLINTPTEQSNLRDNETTI